MSERLRAAMCCAILDLSKPTLELVKERVFGTSALDARTDAEFHVLHAAMLRCFLLAHVKEAIVSAMESSPTTLVEYFRRLRDSPQSALADAKLLFEEALVNLLEAYLSEHDYSLLDELEDYYELLACERFSIEAEAVFRKALRSWLASGALTSAQWVNVRAWWESDTGTLEGFRRRFDRSDLPTTLRAAIDAMDGSSEFQDIEKVRSVLKSFSAVKMNAELGPESDWELSVEGVVVVLSHVLPKISNELGRAKSVCVYATGCFVIDASVNWPGVNLTIVTRRLRVAECGVTVDLSGADSPPSVRTKAEQSKDGERGRAGASSGNLLIAAQHLEGGDRLTVLLNGGRGEDGGDGGDGQPGKNGVGVTTYDLVNGLEWARRNIDPVTKLAIRVFSGVVGFVTVAIKKPIDYVKTGTDSSGRTFTHYIFNRNVINHYELYALHGTKGTPGTAGGAGGRGGEGGFAGSCQICNPFGGPDWETGEVSSRNGEAGKDGKPGKGGEYMDGNDMCMVYVLGGDEEDSFTTPGKKLQQKNEYVFHSSGAIGPVTVSDFYIVADCSRNTDLRQYTSQATATARPTLQVSTAMEKFTTLSETHKHQDAQSREGQVEQKQRTAVITNISSHHSERTEDQIIALISKPTDGEAQHQLMRDHQRAAAEQLAEQWKQRLRTIRSERLPTSMLDKLEHFFDAHNTSEVNAIDAKVFVAVAGGRFFEDSVARELIQFTHNESTSPSASMKLLCSIFDHIGYDSAILTSRSLQQILLHNQQSRGLLIVKLLEEREHPATLTMYDVLRLLQREANRDGLRALSHLSLQEWGEIACSNQWRRTDDHDILGARAYYLEGLPSGPTRSVLREWMIGQTHEGNDKLSDEDIGLVVQLFSSGEVHIKELPLNKKELLERLMLLLSTENTRSCHQLAKLVIGLSDGLKECSRWVETIATSLNDWESLADKSRTPLKNVGEQTPNVEVLSHFNDVLHSVHEIRLRPAQQMVVLCALESQRNLLQQVATGEGKTFIIAAIAAIRCLKSKGGTVDIITASSVLARRDATALKDLFEKLGLTVAHNCDEDRQNREKAYKASVVYGDMAQFQRDYLVHTFYRKNLRGSRRLDAVIVDEVDSMMLDNGNHVLYLSHDVASLKMLDSLFAYIQKEVFMSMDDSSEGAQRYSTEAIRARVLRDLFGQVTRRDLEEIDAENASEAFDRLVKESIIDNEGYLLIRSKENLITECWKERDILRDALITELNREREISLPQHLIVFVCRHLRTFIENCKKATYMKPEVDYVVDIDRLDTLTPIEEREQVVTIVDGDTGADLTSTQWAGGLHQFLQMKHACRISPLSLKAVFVSNVTYLKKYKHIEGLSGTLGSTEESRTLADLYDADLMRMPTARPRMMRELIPVLTHSRDDFIRALYCGISKEIERGRSVLLICKCIDQLRVVQSGLKELNGSHDSVAMNNCIDTMVVYKRAHESLEYEKIPLESGRLIISTNLAGRGTDIILSKGVVKAGGLHVIVAFVPRNRRVEEQAYGRAGRAGDPGSACIIAQVTEADGELFDFKERRDAAEAERIRTLKNNFDYRISVEEDCLARFRQLLDRNLFRSSGDSQVKLPDAEDVIYSALLDEWTLWLDGASAQIDECATSLDVKSKKAIVASVETFVQQHAVAKVEDDEFHVPKWLQAGEWLLRIGLIEAWHSEDHARKTFERLIERDDNFAAYAYYYRACMRMRDLESIRLEKKKSLSLKRHSHVPEHPEEEAASYFARSRTLFVIQMERREAEVLGILKRAVGLIDEKCGLRRQHAELVDAYNVIISSIDWLIGEPILSPEAFRPLTSNVKKQKRLFNAFTMMGVCSAPHLNTSRVCNYQKRELSRKFEIGDAQLAAMLESLCQDARLQEEVSGVKNTVVRYGSELQAHVSIPSRALFWRDMIAVGVFCDAKYVFVAAPEHKERVQKMLGDLASVLEPKPYSIRFSEKPMHGKTLYSESELIAIMDSGDERLSGDQKKQLRTAVDALLASGELEKDLLASIEVDRLNTTLPLLEYDGFTLQQMQHQLQYDETTTGWIIKRLLEANVISSPRPMQLTHFRPMQSTHLNWQWRLQPNEVRFLEQLHHFQHAVTVPPALLEPIVRSRNDASKKDAEDAKCLHAKLLECGVLENYSLLVYRQAGPIDCSCLPPMLASAVHRFLAVHFSFTFSLQVLSAACADARSNHRISGLPLDAVVLQTMLPEYPYDELYDELRRVRIIHPPRILDDRFGAIDYNDFGVSAYELKRFVHARRYKLAEKEIMFDLEPFERIVEERGSELSREMRALIGIGMPAGITLKKQQEEVSIVEYIVKGISSLFGKVFAAVNYVGRMVGTVIGAARKVSGKLLGPIVDACANLIPDKVKECAMEVKELAYQVTSRAIDTASWANEVVKKQCAKARDYIFDTALDLTHELPVLSLVARQISDCFKQMGAYIKGLFGSTEYYQQCRMATQSIASRRGVSEHMDEFRILRAHTQMEMAGYEEGRQITAKQQKLGDIVLSRSRELSDKLVQELTKAIEEAFAKQTSPGSASSSSENPKTILDAIKRLSRSDCYERLKDELRALVRLQQMHCCKDLTSLDRGYAETALTARPLLMTALRQALDRVCREVAQSLQKPFDTTVTKEAEDQTVEDVASSDAKAKQDTIKVLRTLIDSEIQRNFVHPLERMISRVFCDQSAFAPSPEEKSVREDDLARKAISETIDDSSDWLHELLDAQLVEVLGDAAWPGRVISADRIRIILMKEELRRTIEEGHFPTLYEPLLRIIPSFLPEKLRQKPNNMDFLERTMLRMGEDYGSKITKENLIYNIQSINDEDNSRIKGEIADLTAKLTEERDRIIVKIRKIHCLDSDLLTESENNANSIVSAANELLESIVEVSVQLESKCDLPWKFCLELMLKIDAFEEEIKGVLGKKRYCKHMQKSESVKDSHS